MKIKINTNTGFIERTLRYWNGTSWATPKSISRWVGSSWQTSSPTPPIGVFGFAAQGTGTTGGAGGTVLSSSNPAEIIAYLETDEPKTLYFTQSFDYGTTPNVYLQVGSNTTLIAEPGVKLTNVGLKINDASNIIIKNLTIEKVLQGTVDNDCISIRNGHHIWIDHCNLSSSLDYRELDYEYYDGLIDVSDGSDFITVSNSHLHDSWKAMMIDGDKLKPANLGKMNITIAYNKYERCHERSPLVRACKVHFFNNYLLDCGGFEEGAGSGVASMDDAIVRTDNNYFHNARNPIITRSGTEPDGFVANPYSNIKTGVESDGYLITTTISNWNAPYSYNQYLLPAASIPNYVNANIGPK